MKHSPREGNSCKSLRILYRQKEMCCLYRKIHVPIMVSMVFRGLYCFSEDFQARSGYGEGSKDHVFYSVISPTPLRLVVSYNVCNETLIVLSHTVNGEVLNTELISMQLLLCRNSHHCPCIYLYISTSNAHHCPCIYLYISTSNAHHCPCIYLYISTSNAHHSQCIYLYISTSNAHHCPCIYLYISTSNAHYCPCIYLYISTSNACCVNQLLMHGLTGM